MILYGEKELCEQHMGKYPVIHLSLKDVEGRTFESALKMLSGIMKQEARRHQYLLDSSRLTEIDKESLKQLYAPGLDEDTVKRSLNLLSELLGKHYGRRVVILIDEYDVPLDKAQHFGYYDDMVKLIRSLYSRALKSNDFRQFAVMTGCLKIVRRTAGCWCWGNTRAP